MRSFIHYAPLLMSMFLIGLVSDLQSSHAGHSGRPTIVPDIAPEIEPYQPSRNAKGYLTMVVKDDIHVLMDALVEAFRHWHPELKIAIQPSQTYSQDSRLTLDSFLHRLVQPRLKTGNHRGFFGSHDIRLLGLSRKLTQEEKSEFISRFGYRPLEIPIARNMLVFYVNYKNPIKGLTLEQIQALFSAPPNGDLSSQLRKWGELGVNGEWNVAPITLYVPHKQHALSAHQFIREYVLRNGPFRNDVSSLNGSASVVLAVSNDLHGIGVADFGFQIPHVRVLPVAKKAKLPFVNPTTRTIMNNTYPLTHFIYLYVNKSPTDNLPEDISEFLIFIHSREGQEVVLNHGRFPLNTSEVQRNLQIFNPSPQSQAKHPQPPQ